MKVTHPRLYNLLNKVAKEHFIDNFFLDIDTLLDGLCTKISIYSDQSFFRTIRISISDDLIDKTPQAKRLFKCYLFWIPYCIDILNKIENSFSLKLNAADEGVSDFLSMTYIDIKNVIPDEYSMIESERLKSIKFPKNFEDFNKIWLRKKSSMYWRGSTTGPVYSSINEFKELQRVKISMLYKNINNFDIKISNIVQNKLPKQIIKQWLQKEKIFARRVNEVAFQAYKYHPDIPGNNLACGSWGVIRKYLKGILVFRPPHSSYMFYDRFLQPWVHYIPVAIDFIDLYEKYIWAEKNQDKASMIAWRGSLIAKEYLSNIKYHFRNSALEKIKVIEVF